MERAFQSFHKWMDEPSAILGANHRKYRHDPNITPKEPRQLFGENADNACLDHIRLDTLEKPKNGFGFNVDMSWNLEQTSPTWIQKYCSNCGLKWSENTSNCPICNSTKFYDGYKQAETVCSKCFTNYDDNYGKCPKCGYKTKENLYKF